ASRAIYTKIRAQADAGRAPWDIDVALVSMAVASQMVKEGLLLRYVTQMKNAALVKGAEVKEAFGVTVDGYVVPMFQNQIAIAYNPAKVATPPRTFDDLAKWVAAHPGKFGYNGIKGGVSGVGFTMGWVYWKTGLYKQLTQGPFDRSREGAIREAITALRDFNKNVLVTNGNAGTLDALNRGEIAMGAVWIDQLVAWKNEGRMDPSITPVLPAPGLPLAVLGVVFLWPLAASIAASFTRGGALTLANYETVWRLYLRDVFYTLGVAAAGAALTFALAIPVCGWLRARAFGPVEFLLKV